MMASYCGLEEIVGLLLQENGLPLDFQDGTSQRPSRTCGSIFITVLDLVTLVKPFNFDVIRNFLSLNLKDTYGSTALRYAAAGKHMDVIQLLLPRGASINAKDSIDGTSLMDASKIGHQAVVQQLLDNGVNAKSENVLGLTPIL
ncbi:ankyrin repeat-containing domain protein [Jackrogersella minutella]|nr:ankyrin repeat-containing domain protein [Jackrogersella minutella]